ncbi:LamG-like jellyroll fold domain-containing protein [Olleya aquimaris]|uniref:Putative secreted protein (Por secretion system target) n=1 Tax=Olleya aquimaris TaxID=639310 RepID=A0A327RGK9_9FLAO|nr:LamG-like jellyroll fold domain-containing protein [Olleya aquimaris]RAJ14583.1 putative secreted protein (Por secretion system target) [Olleya aquimaris]
MNTKTLTLIYLLLLGFNLSVFAQNPGNVPTGLQLWLKADSGTNLSGSDVTSWEDQSINSITGSSDGVNHATIINDGLNFNPIVQFSGDEFYNYGTPVTLNIDPSLLGMTIISVVKTDQAQGGTVISKGDNTNRNFQLHFDATHRVVHNTFGRSISNNAERVGTFHTLNEAKLSSNIVNLAIVDPLLRLTPFVNGIADPSTTNDGVQSGTSNLSDVLIGARRQTVNSGSTDFFNGDIAEVIVYNRDLTVLELQQVESYLAIKYGITLGANDQTWDSSTSTATDLTYSGTSTNYFNSLGNIVWNGAANSGYGHNVIGIARDDNSSLLQTKSTSSSTVTESILTIEGEIGSFLNDDSYLIIGSNGGETTLTSTGTPTRTTQVLNRMWKVSEANNDTGLVKLEFDLNGTTITNAEATELDLLVADDASLDDYKNYRGSYNTSTKILTYNLIELKDGQLFTLAIPDVIAGPFQILLDGVDDLITTNLDLSGLPEVTIMCWVKKANDSELLQTGIIGQNGVFGLSTLNDDLSVIWGGNIVGGLDLTQTGLGNTGGTWHHIAASFKNGFIKMYFDGELVDSFLDTSGNTVLGLASVATFNIGGDITSLLGTDNFEGEIDEVRVFNKALEDEQLQQIVYQEIENNAGNVRGSVIPKDIKDHALNSTVSWLDLSLYYTMNVVRGNCVVDGSGNALNGSIQGISSNTLWNQTTPMPYVSVNDGAWTSESTWLHGDVWDIEDLPNKDWSIVEINSNVDTNSAHTHLGLIVNPGNTLTINGTNELKNTWFLDLNGTIDLKEDSQLIQTELSDLNVTSAGKILRRQEGVTSMHRYNYWSSPVGAISTTSNNTDFSVNMLQDNNGFIQFVNTYDAPSTTPASISRRWLYTFQNGVTYYDWIPRDENSLIPAGVGYTQKGPGVAGTEFQYIFEGKPNNGDVIIPVVDTGGPGSVHSSTQTLYLLGNPYPSAIDAHQFLDDNASVCGGTIYLWEQWSGNSHNLAEYNGGYATLNKFAKVPAYQFVGINGANNGFQDGTKTPTQFLPVGQGFMTEIVLDGDIVFNNSQRVFKEEALGESVFFRTGNTNNQADNDLTEVDACKKIRLEFKVDNKPTRELVIGFCGNTTDGFDYGYDSKPNEFNNNDIATSLNGDKMLIQVLSEFSEDKLIDLILSTRGNHNYSITLTEKINFDESQEIFIYDAFANKYYDLSNFQNYNFNSADGINPNRLKVVFKQQATSNFDNQSDNVFMYLDQDSNTFYAKGLQQDASMLQVINMHGQIVHNTSNNTNKSKLDQGVLLDKFSTGVYIVKLTLNNGETLSKKIIMK